MYQVIKINLRQLSNKLFKNKNSIKLCSDCFSDSGIQREASLIGRTNGKACENCKSTNGAKINTPQIEILFHRFFSEGSYIRTEFGGASMLASNQMRYGEHEVDFPNWLEPDVKLLENILEYGLFHYGPPLWRFGKIEQLEDLRNRKKRNKAISSLVQHFPTVKMNLGEKFYRIRKDLKDGDEFDEKQFDSPPLTGRKRFGRLDSKTQQILYGSVDLEICAHECRISIPDECFVATLITKRSLKLLDFTTPSNSEAETPFNDLDLAIKFLFSASSTSYEITQDIANYLSKKGYDGIRYPSYFSLVKKSAVPNIALFGSPIQRKDIAVKSINRLHLKQVSYELSLGPIFK